MIDQDVIDDEIAALEEEGETTYEVCEKLACLYTVRNEIRTRKVKEDPSSSEFLAASVGVPIPDLMRILDEHMDAIKALYPTEYDQLVGKIKALHTE